MPVRFVWAVCVLTNLAQPLTQVALAPQAILVWPVRAFRVLVRPRRRQVLVREVMRAEFVLKVCAATMCAVNISQPDHATAERFVMRLRGRLSALFPLAVMNTSAVLAPVKTKFVSAVFVRFRRAVKTFSMASARPVRSVVMKPWFPALAAA